MTNNTIHCRICRSPSSLFYEDTRKFFACAACHHIFTQQVVNNDQSRHHYLAQWGLEDDLWWKEAAERIIWGIKVFHEPKRILNFGSGRGELSTQLKSMGYHVTSFEPLIHGAFCDQAYERKFDTVIATEVIEHIINIHEELHRIFAVLETECLLYFTTLIANPFDTADPRGSFSGFWYKDDQTHVNFFCRKSVETLARLHNCEPVFLEEKGFILLPLQA